MDAPPHHGLRSDPPYLNQLLRQCIHCGLCLAACPTYQLLGTEMDSPRGRIALLRGVFAGQIAPKSSAFAQHFDRCLGCLACEVACPSDVQYDQLLEIAQSMVLQSRRPSLGERFLRWLTMRALLPHVGRMRLVAQLASVYRATGVQRIVRRLGFLPAPLRAAYALLPPSTRHRPHTSVSASNLRGIPLPRRGRIGLFLGCVQEGFLSHVNRATVRVLERNGYEVVIPAGQTCCGALHRHLGERDLARDLARRNIDAFLAADVDAIVVNAGGCGAALKAYASLLVSYPDAGRVRDFCARLRDLSELLAGSDITPPQGQFVARVTHADSCHLRHAQGIAEQPRALLRSIHGLELVELAHPGDCCGSAGVYNIAQPAIAGRLLDAKLADIAASGAEVVVTTNPGCQLQIMAGVRQARLPVRVMHLAELLDEAYAPERADGDAH